MNQKKSAKYSSIKIKPEDHKRLDKYKEATGIPIVYQVTALLDQRETSNKGKD